MMDYSRKARVSRTSRERVARTKQGRGKHRQDIF